MNKSTFNKAILFTVYEYLDKATKEDSTYQRTELIKLKSSITGYRVFHRFSKEEALNLEEIGKRPEFIRLRENEVDWAIYALELMFLYISFVNKSDRPVMNYSDTRVKKLKANLITDMLKLKHKDAESHARIKSIIDDSRLTAKMYLGLLIEEVK